MAPPASDDSRLVSHTDYEPTINTFIEPPGDPVAAPPAPSFMSPPPPPPTAKCCPMPRKAPESPLPPPTAIDPVTALGASLGVGIIIGALIVFAFSKPSLPQCLDD